MVFRFFWCWFPSNLIRVRVGCLPGSAQNRFLIKMIYRRYRCVNPITIHPIYLQNSPQPVQKWRIRYWVFFFLNNIFDYRMTSPNNSFLFIYPAPALYNTTLTVIIVKKKKNNNRSMIPPVTSHKSSNNVENRFLFYI